MQVILLKRSPSQASKQSLYKRLYDGMLKEHQVQLDTNSICNFNIGPAVGSPGQILNLVSAPGECLCGKPKLGHLCCPACAGLN